MKKVFIIHGFQGTPNGGWRPWLMKKLAEEYVYACALPMPTSEHPKEKDWIQAIVGAVNNTSNEDIILVGHSLGVPAILRYLETFKDGMRIAGAILVSGTVEMLPEKENEPYVHFINHPFDFDFIKKSCKSFYIIHGDNDELVPFSDAEYLSKKLSCPLISIPSGGHLNFESGYTKLPEALNAIKEIIAHNK